MFETPAKEYGNNPQQVIELYYTFNTDGKAFFISGITSELGFPDLLQANFMQQWVQASLLAKVIVIAFAQEVFMEKRN